MGIVSYRGSLEPKSSVTQSKNRELKQKELSVQKPQITTLVNLNQDKRPTTGVVADHNADPNALVNKTASRGSQESSYRNTALILSGFSAGHVIKVTYYHLKRGELLGSVSSTDVSTGELNITHSSYLRINNMELIFQGPLNIQYNEEDSVMDISGTAITMAGFQPKLGDLFVYAIGNNDNALFAVRSLERLAIDPVSQYKIEFSIHQYLTQEMQDYLEKQVVDVAYFDKFQYLTKPFTLLKQDAYLLLKRFEILYSEMVEYYYDTYYDRTLGSYVRYDGVYDPYLVRFLQQIIPISTKIRRPKQLALTVDFTASDIWTSIHNRKNLLTSPVTPVQEKIVRYSPSYWTASVSSLIGREYLTLEPVTEPVAYDTVIYPYISYGFYKNHLQYPTSMETILYKYLYEDNDPDLSSTLEELLSFTSWDVKKAFYYIPFSLVVIDKIQNILTIPD